MPAPVPLPVPRPDGPAQLASTLLTDPPGAEALALLAHGAGAGATHPFMEAIARALAARKIATLRLQFPYMEAGRKMPDRRPTLLASLRAGFERAEHLARGRPWVAGGKSMGGRMASLLWADGAPTPPPRGLVFLGFPLHPAGKPGTDRAAHLAALPIPSLFLQGTRDRLADLTLLRPLLAPLAPRARLHVVEGADHGFAVRKRDGRGADEVLGELADTMARWIRSAPWGDHPGR